MSKKFPLVIHFTERSYNLSFKISWAYRLYLFDKMILTC